MSQKAALSTHFLTLLLPCQCVNLSTLLLQVQVIYFIVHSMPHLINQKTSQIFYVLKRPTILFAMRVQIIHHKSSCDVHTVHINTFIHHHQNFLFICEMISLWDSKFKKTNCNWINYWIFIFYLFNFAVGFVEFTVTEVGVDDVMLTFCEWRSRPKTDRKRSSRCFSRSSARSTFGGDRFLIEFHICAGNF